MLAIWFGDAVVVSYNVSDDVCVVCVSVCVSVYGGVVDVGVVDGVGVGDGG